MNSIRTGLLSFARLALLCSVACASEMPQIARVADPCTDKEVWEFSPALPLAWQERFQLSAEQSHASEFTAFSSAASLKKLAKKPALKTLGDYEMARALFRMGLLSLALERFNGILSDAVPEANGLRVAALMCIGRIHEKSPGLGLPKKSVGSLAASPIVFSSTKERDVFLGLLVSYSERQIAESASPELAGPLSMLRGSEPYESYVMTLQAAKAGNPVETLKNGERFLTLTQNEANIPPGMKPRVDAARVLIGQTYYEAGKYKEAAKAFRAVSSDSNYLTQALTDLAWTYLLERQYDDSMGAARNLLLGLLKRTFSPESNLVSAMDFLETCHYAEALQSANMLQKSYWPSYNWLYSWHKGLPNSAKLYPTLVKFMEKKAKVPVRVASEWLRSPVFIRAQEDLNLIYDERSGLKSLIPELDQFRKQHRGLAGPLPALIAELKDERGRNRKRETELIAAINADLAQRTQSMLADVSDVWENSELLAVETYNRVGDKIMADNFAGKAGQIVKNRDSRKNDGPVWDWGKIPSGDDDSAEVWEDEVGFLKMDLKDQCQKPQR